MKTNMSVVIEQARYPLTPVGSCQVLSLSHQKSRHQNRKHRPRLLHPVRAMTSLDFIYGLAQPLAAHAALEQQHGVAPISLQTSALLTATSDSNASIYALFGGQALTKYTLTNFRHFTTHVSLTSHL